MNGSFLVHLQSLKDLTVQLQEQLEVVRQPARRAAETLSQAPSLPLGAFAEAYSRSDDHTDVARQMAVVLENVGRSLDFARSVTALVAQRYEAVDAGGALNLGPAGPAPASVPSVMGAAAPPAGGTVYYYNGSTAVPVSVTVQARDA